jgi:hypothetical protein
MNFEKIVKKELIYSQIFILIGIIAGITALVFNYQKELMLGITVGFLPTGIGTMLVYKYGSKKVRLKKNIELENEERNIFINTKAGHTAFWVSYWYIFIVEILNYSIKLNLQQFLIITLFFMPIVYFIIILIYHKKY